jgi:hypothetical protein
MQLDDLLGLGSVTLTSQPADMLQNINLGGNNQVSYPKADFGFDDENDN